MDQMLALLGFLFFMFLVLSAAAAVMLEFFRGTLEHFGITWAKEKVSLDDALQTAARGRPLGVMLT